MNPKLDTDFTEPSKALFKTKVLIPEELKKILREDTSQKRTYTSKELAEEIFKELRDEESKSKK